MQLAALRADYEAQLDAAELRHMEEMEAAVKQAAAAQQEVGGPAMLAWRMFAWLLCGVGGHEYVLVWRKLGQQSRCWQQRSRSSIGTVEQKRRCLHIYCGMPRDLGS